SQMKERCSLGGAVGGELIEEGNFFIQRVQRTFRLLPEGGVGNVLVHDGGFGNVEFQLRQGVEFAAYLLGVGEAAGLSVGGVQQAPQRSQNEDFDGQRD